jgi:hypothetical protein
MKVRCKKTIFDWSIAKITFREDHWYDIQTIGKSVYMLDENGLIHSFSYDEYDTVFESKNEIRNNKIEELIDAR